MEQEAIFSQVIILGIVGLIGVIAAKAKVISSVVNDSLAGIIINITAPFMIISSLSGLEFTDLIIKNSLWVFVFSYMAIFVLMGLGFLSFKILGLKEDLGKVHVLHTTYGNIVFLGFPVINELFPGGEALLYAGIYQVASNSIMWTWAVYYLRKDKNQSFGSNLKKLANPNTIALVLGLLIMAFQIRLPFVLQKSMGGLGNTTLYLAMLYIGGLLASIKLLDSVKNLHVWILSLNKLVLGPFIVLLIIQAIISLTGLHLGYIALTVVVLEAAMPCMVIIIILVKKYGGDEKSAIGNLFLTTVLSFITLPLVNYLIKCTITFFTE
ncbi:MAG: AEC family transporter [Bacteroidales bacterium]|nr:AEC family transporter [Bacteroidales bacterium]